MEGWVDLDVGELRLRTLGSADVAALVDATSGESGPALWGPRPAGPYTPADAVAALREWDATSGGQVSVGLFRDDRLVGALALMPDGPGSAELAYWIRPEERGRGLAVRGLQAFTGWALEAGGLKRAWLEIDPANTASRRVAERSGYLYEQLLTDHCRAWTRDDPAVDERHDCEIWVRRQ